MGGLLKFLSLVLFTLISPWALAERNTCSRLDGLMATRSTQLPKQVRIGVSNVFKEESTQSIWHPRPSQEAPGFGMDLIRWSPEEPLPERFVLNDGALTRAAIGVDQREGTELDIALTVLKARVVRAIKEKGRRITPEEVIHFLTYHLVDLFEGRWKLGVDRAGDNVWDPKPFKPSERSSKIFASLLKLPGVHEPLSTDELLPVVPFERFLTESCSSYCLHKVLLTRLLLDRFKIPSRFVLGVVIVKDKEGKPVFEGHSWLELEHIKGSSRFVLMDPTHRILERKEKITNRRENVQWWMLVFDSESSK